MYEIVVYTHNGAILPNDVSSLDDVFEHIKSFINDVQLITLQKL